ncbi:MAG TPA: cytochrome c [Anaerolineae bacterium]|nr:cytochrome c [Anaerolineae bacterium]
MKQAKRVISYVFIGLMVLGLVAACAPAATPVPPTPVPPAAAGGEVEVARPSNPGGPGPAIGLTGDVKAGEKIFVDSCQKCHGEKGVSGVKNEGSDDGTIPELNPIDETLIDKDLKVYATNLDLFIEHGSTAAGPRPKEKMDSWGDSQKLTPQQIADVIAYIISLNSQ